MVGGEAADIQRAYTGGTNHAPYGHRHQDQASMRVRRLIVVMITCFVCLALGCSLYLTLSPGGWTAAKLVMMVSCLCAAPWVGFCAANGLIGFVLLLPRAPVPPEVNPSGLLPRTAIAVTIRDEDMTLVLPPLARLLAGLDAAGHGDAFELFILSDSQGRTDAEERAVAAFGGRRVHYRRRLINTGFKAGNIMTFLDQHGDAFELMLVLDADSEMTPQAVFRMICAMREDPRLGIIQHLTIGLPASAAFPRLFQFGMRAGMRTWATALDWWQGDECVYWGHNALIRTVPFRTHCRLPLLPGGGHILSHDQVEAAMLRAAGWKIRLLPEEDGSREANPPALPEFMRRELRWLAGNFEYRHLLTMPGLRPMGRWQLVQAILLFACTPFYLPFLLATAWAATTDHASGFPSGPTLTTTAIWAGALYAPKLLGYLEVLLSEPKASRYGGRARFLTSAILEIVFTLLLDAINTFAKTVTTIRIALGMRAGWYPQNRMDRGVSWWEAARLLWPQTVLGTLVFAGLSQAGWTAVVWAAPFAGVWSWRFRFAS